MALVRSTVSASNTKNTGKAAPGDKKSSAAPASATSREEAKVKSPESMGWNYDEISKNVMGNNDPVLAAYQAALTMGQQSGAETEEELFDYMDQVLPNILKFDKEKAAEGKNLSAEQIANLNDPYAGLTAKDIQRHYTGANAGTDLVDFLGDSVDNINKGAGGVIDWLGDNITGNVIGAFNPEAGQQWKDFADGEDVAGVLSGAEDIGLWLVPGAGPFLAAGKAALDNRENIARAVSGRDPLTLEMITPEQRATNAGAAAFDIALSSLPGMGAGKAVLKQGERAAGKALTNAEKSLAGSEDAAKPFVKELEVLAESQGKKLPKGEMTAANREKVMKDLIEDSNKNLTEAGKAAESARTEIPQDAIESLNNAYKNLDLPFNAARENVSTKKLGGAPKEEIKKASDDLQKAFDKEEDLRGKVEAAKSINVLFPSVKHKGNVEKLEKGLKKAEDKVEQARKRLDDLSPQERTVGVYDVNGLNNLYKQAAEIRAAQQAINPTARIQAADAALEKELGRGEALQAIKSDKNARQAFEQADADRAAVSGITDDLAAFEQALENRPGKGLTDRLTKKKSAREKAPAESDVYEMARDYARREIPEDAAAWTVPFRRFGNSMLNIGNRMRGGTTQELNERAAQQMAGSKKIPKKVQKQIDKLEKDGKTEAANALKADYDSGITVDQALENLNDMRAIPAALARARAEGLGPSRLIGDFGEGMVRGVAGMGNNALQLAAAMGTDPSTALQDFAALQQDGAGVNPALALALIAPGPKRYVNRLLGGGKRSLPYHAARMNIMNDMMRMNPAISSAIPTQEAVDFVNAKSEQDQAAQQPAANQAENGQGMTLDQIAQFIMSLPNQIAQGVSNG